MIAWSYSRYALWARCPAAFRYKHVLRLPEEQSQAQMRGEQFHKALELYARTPAARRPPRLPPELMKVAPRLEAIRKTGRPAAEGELAFTRDWKTTSWFGRDVYCRVKADLIYRPHEGAVVVIDHKTGRVKPEEHEEQVSLYALAVMIAFERELTEQVSAGLWYVDHEEEPRLVSIYEAPFKRHVKSLSKKWDRKVAGLQADTKFRPTPSRHACRWCAFGASKGGPCTAEAT